MNRKKIIKYSLVGLLAIFITWLWIVPCRLFSDVSYSTVVEDRNGQLIGARISQDQQWRFPLQDSLPEKYEKCLVRFEDKGFYHHLGVSPSAIARAIKQNLEAGRIKSGASTITMQVARMSRRKERTFMQKLIEAFMAFRIEAQYSKHEILQLYAAHAPYGGNVVGFPAGCWRYLGHDGSNLSWGEAAVMAVLQNSPSMINLAKKRPLLLEKRNRLLKSLYESGDITKGDYELAIEEPLPSNPNKIPSAAPHLVEWYAQKNNGEYVRTTVDLNLQKDVEAIAKRRNDELRIRGIHDLAIVVIDVQSGEVIAYCGNANSSVKRAGVCVDVARSRRSSGSLLKPLLYCAALQDGYILPNTLLPDIPININGFRPSNYNKEFCGAVPASEALSKSLNVPNVLLLRDYGIDHFIEILRRCGLSTINRTADVYGLSLILGGAEISLLDITRAYAKMARNYEYSVASRNNDYDNPGYVENFEKSFILTDKTALFHTIEAMKRVERLDHMDMYKISGYRDIAWKTGTSYGARDAWSVGFDHRYAVGVWAGNAEGQGVAELTGVHTASPVMFDVFNHLTYSKKDGKKWFTNLKVSDGVEMKVCRQSGMLASLECPNPVTQVMPFNGVNSGVCKYHHVVKVTEDGKYRVSNMDEASVNATYFTLPANMEYFYKKNHPEYITLPPYSDVFIGEKSKSNLGFIYPQNGAVLSCVGKSADEENGVLFELAHKRPMTEVFWFIDGRYLSSTVGEHKLQIEMEEGKHKISVVDENGDKAEVRVENRR
ncbi:MAG: penicillin-binding protein 1C [Paludibacteraceae bacterium]|nr:penicillin-binding protein 1C [Paludibacteraceae bacterium]